MPRPHADATGLMIQSDARSSVDFFSGPPLIVEGIYIYIYIYIPRFYVKSNFGLDGCGISGVRETRKTCTEGIEKENKAHIKEYTQIIEAYLPRTWERSVFTCRRKAARSAGRMKASG